MSTPLTGRALDCALATALGWVQIGHSEDYDDWFGQDPEFGLGRGLRVPSYSSDLVTAFKLVDHLRALGWLVVIKAMPDDGSFLAGGDRTRDPEVRSRYVAEVTRMPWAGDYAEHPTGQRAFWAFADAAPEAIARAALAALEPAP